MAPSLSVDVDVLIVGGGPAGAAAATTAARAGARTLVLERSAFPRAKACGGCLNDPALRTLAELGVELRDDAVRRAPAAGVPAAPVDRVVVRAGRGSVSVPLPRTRAIDRAILDAALLDRAAAAGARVRHGVTARVDDHAPRDDDDVVRVHWRGPGGEGACRAAAIVLADGGGRRATPGAPARPVVGGAVRTGVGTIVPAPHPAARRLADAVPPRTLLMVAGRGGYAGAVRLADGGVDLAACLDPAASRAAGGPGAFVAALLADVAGTTDVQGDLAALLADLDWHGAARLDRRADAAPFPRGLRAGDAAGYIEPFTGEGIGRALATGAAAGRYAARIAAGALDPGAAAVRWRADLRRNAGGDLACRLLARLLRHPAATRAAVRAAGSVPIVARRLVGATGRRACGGPAGLGAESAA